jgi:acetyl esterase/lipase
MYRNLLSLPATRLAALAALVVGLCSVAAQGQDERARLRERAAQLVANLPPEAQPNEKLVYRTTDQGKPLSIWVYWPGGKRPANPLPAIVLYHGGGWTTGTPVFYLGAARHFVERGMIALLPEYRVNESSGSKIPDSTRDARAAMRWVKAHAGELGIDVKRLSAGGGSAGGQLAASLGAAKVDHPNEPAIDPRPEALVLFNPGVNFTYPAFAGAGLKDNPAVAGVALEDLADSDPMKNLAAGYPPCIVFHGTADATVPFGAVEEFVAAVNAAGGACELVPFEGAPHSFYQGQRNRANFEIAMERADAFLTERGLMTAR